MDCLRPRRILARGLVLLLILGSVHAEAKDELPQTKEGFLQGLAEVREDLGRDRVARAKAAFDELLTRHSRKPYVLGRVVELKDLARDLAFRKAHPLPDPQDMIKGKLIRYSKRTHMIKVEYTPQTLKADWPRQAGFNFHDGGAAGPYKLKIEGSSWPSPPKHTPAVFLGGVQHPETGNLQSWIFVLGAPKWIDGEYERWIPRTVIYRDGESEKKLLKPSVLSSKPHGPFRLEFRVTDNSIKVRLNSDTLGRFKKTKGVYGNIGIDIPHFEKLTLEGKIEPSWIQGRIDAWMQKKRGTFDKTFRVEKHLPSWVLEGGLANRPGERPELPEVPTGLTTSQIVNHDLVLRLMASGQRLAAQERMEKSNEKALSPVSRAYILALDHLFQGDYKNAVKQARSARRGDPKYVTPAVVEALALQLQNDPEGAQNAIKIATKAHDLDDSLFFLAGINLLRRSRFDQAKVVMRYGLSLGLHSEYMTRLHRIMLKATKGPGWSRIYDHKTTHYHVFSDIDQKTCSEAARMLERMYSHFEGKMERDERGTDPKRFPVYLFRGQQGFVGYVRDLEFLGSSLADKAAGLYSPFLKQLLIWNLPQREEMLKTVRHEGLHQYLDQRLPNAPIWLDEGLAVYFEFSILYGSRIESGQVNGFGLMELKKKGLVPLKEFVARDHNGFHRDSQHSYAQSWLLVHMLREGSTSHKALFGEIWDALESETPRESLAKVLDEDRLKRLDRDLASYYKKLCR